MYEYIHTDATGMRTSASKIPRTYSALTLTVLALLMLALAPATSLAAEFKGVAGIGWDMIGGDSLITGTCAECGTPALKANNGFTVHAGGVIINDSYETQATIGYKYGSPAGESGSITWEAIPIEIIQFYRPTDIRIGLGFIFQINPRLRVDVPGLSYSNNYDNAFGTLAQIGWAPKNDSYTVDLRFSAVTYKQNNMAYPQELNGYVFGIYSNYYF